jgi:hypothetical protein
VDLHLKAFFQNTKIKHDKYIQSGFRKNHSCNTAILRLNDAWIKDIDNGKMIGAIFLLDLRKAFDLVVIFLEKKKTKLFVSFLFIKNETHTKKTTKKQTVQFCYL